MSYVGCPKNWKPVVVVDKDGKIVGPTHAEQIEAERVRWANDPANPEREAPAVIAPSEEDE